MTYIEIVDQKDIKSIWLYKWKYGEYCVDCDLWFV